jgi:hypothetical protein
LPNEEPHQQYDGSPHDAHPISPPHLARPSFRSIPHYMRATSSNSHAAEEPEQGYVDKYRSGHMLGNPSATLEPSPTVQLIAQLAAKPIPPPGDTEERYSLQVRDTTREVQVANLTRFDSHRLRSIPPMILGIAKSPLSLPGLLRLQSPDKPVRVLIRQIWVKGIAIAIISLSKRTLTKRTR